MDATTKEKLAALYELLKSSHDIEDGSEGPRPNWAMRCTNAIDSELDSWMRGARPVDLPSVLDDVGEQLEELAADSVDVSRELALLAEVRATLPACVWCGEAPAVEGNHCSAKCSEAAEDCQREEEARVNDAAKDAQIYRSMGGARREER